MALAEGKRGVGVPESAIRLSFRLVFFLRPRLDVAELGELPSNKIVPVRALPKAPSRRLSDGAPIWKPVEGFLTSSARLAAQPICLRGRGGRTTNLDGAEMKRFARTRTRRRPCQVCSSPAHVLQCTCRMSSHRCVSDVQNLLAPEHQARCWGYLYNTPIGAP